MFAGQAPGAKRPEASMRLYHLSQSHPEELRPDLVRLATECISPVAADVYEVVEEEDEGI
jgi:hypothetical protein